MKDMEFFYFGITQKMLDRFSMPERIEGETYSWKLNENSCIAGLLGVSAGVLLDELEELKQKKPYAICRAQLKNRADMLNCISSALLGCEINDLDVIVDEITWMTK